MLINLTRNLTVCLLLSVAVYGGDVQAEQKNEYFSNEYHFRIIFPEGWKVMETQFGEVQAVSRVGRGKEAFITIHKEEATKDHKRVLENKELEDYRLSFF